MTESTRDPVQVVEAYADLWNEQNYANIPNVVSESFVLYDGIAPGGEVHGHDGLEEWMHAFTSAFPDFHVDTLDAIAEGNTVVVEGRYTMTHEGEFDGIPPTGRAVELRGMAKFLVDDGKVREHREYHDNQRILEQLGVTEE